jgi:hypothetical protein
MAERMTTDNPTAGTDHPALTTVPEKLPRISHPHAPKFRGAFMALGGIAVAAILVVVGVIIHDDNRANPSKPMASSKAWSDWTPTSSGSAGITEVADFVAPYYRSNAAEQLDAITPISVSQSNAAGTTTGKGMTVVVNTASSSAKAESLELLTGKTVAYNICGLGPKDCELAGTPTANRGLLMRREALELALYTFKYTDASNVVTVLPPEHSITASGTDGAKVTVATLFERAELQSLLDKPLKQTLSDYPLDISELGLWSKTTEAALVQEITTDSLYSAQVEAQQEGGTLLVLNPLPSQ